MSSDNEYDNDEEKILQFYDYYRHLRAKIHDDPHFGHGFHWDTFCKMASMLSIKALGTRIQNRIAKKNGYKSVPPADNRGDFVTPKGEHIEFKSSVLTPVNTRANIRGIRTWHNIQAYLIMIIDLRGDPNTYTFRLSAMQMEEELKLMANGDTSTHLIHDQSGASPPSGECSTEGVVNKAGSNDDKPKERQFDLMHPLILHQRKPKTS